MIFRRQKFLTILGALFLSCIAINAQTNPTPTTEKFPSVQIKGSEIRSLKSKETGRDYDLYIHPVGDLKSDKKYPVLFVLDGQWDFKLLDSVYGGLHYDQFVPDMIIVGITYSGENPDFDALRAMDYTPTPAKGLTGSGDAAKFLAFLKNDVIPFIEKNYHADPSKRILMGSSLGGLFTLYTMFIEPGLFYGYVAASPAVSYDDKFSFKQEKLFFDRRKDLPVRLFVSVGDIEILTQSVKDFLQIFKSRSYQGLTLEARIIEGERHAGNKPEAFNRGLRFIFAGQ